MYMCVYIDIDIDIDICVCIYIYIHTYIHTYIHLQVGKEYTYSAGGSGHAGSIPESRGSPGRGYGNPLQYSCLVNPMDKGA